jgi:cell division protein FtsL
MQFKESVPSSFHERKGDYKLAAYFILNKDWDNLKIARKSGVSKARISQLRRDVLKNKVKYL